MDDHHDISSLPKSNNRKKDERKANAKPFPIVGMALPLSMPREHGCCPAPFFPTEFVKWAFVPVVGAANHFIRVDFCFILERPLSVEGRLLSTSSRRGDAVESLIVFFLPFFLPLFYENWSAGSLSMTKQAFFNRFHNLLRTQCFKAMPNTGRVHNYESFTMKTTE